MNTSMAVESLNDAAAGLLCVAADPVRWRLLAVLAGGPRCVCELLPAARVSAPALSHHLRVMRLGGLVTASRRGRWIDYALAPDAAQRLAAALPLATGDGRCPGRVWTRPAAGRAAAACARGPLAREETAR